jgi:hypothetical protein
MGLIFDRYPAGGGEMILALKLADHAHDDGTHIFPGIASLAEKTRQSERAVQYQLRRMEKSGWLIAVDQGKGGRGRSREYRISPAWLNGAELAPIKEDEKGADSAPIPEDAKGATDDTKGATGSIKGANGDIKGATAIAPESSVTVIEPSGNRQPARRASRIALHVELRATELPDWLPVESWADWCEHRETKHADGDAPWTRVAAKISLKRLAKLREQGHDAVACIEEAALRGWTGLFPVKGDTQATPTPAGIPADWWKTESGITACGQQHGIERKPGQMFEQFKAKVFKAMGPGEWMEDMLRTVSRESESRGEALYAYFNDIRAEKVAQAEAA